MLKQNRNLFVICVTTLFVHVLAMPRASADCRPVYVETLKGMEGRANPPRTTMIASGGGAVLTPLAASAIGATVAPAALIAAPATAAVAGGYLLVMSLKKRSLTKAYKLIREAEKGEGKILNRFLDQIGAETDEDRSEAINWILEENNANAFCPAKGVLEVMKPMTYRKILRAARSEF